MAEARLGVNGDSKSVAVTTNRASSSTAGDQNRAGMGRSGDSTTLIALGGTVAIGDEGANAVTPGHGVDRATSGADDAVVSPSAGGGNPRSSSALFEEHNSAPGQSNNTNFTKASNNQLWFERSNDHLLTSIIGASSQTDVAAWFGGEVTPLQSITAADSKTLANDDVNALISAMASFNARAAGATALPETSQSQLHSVIAASWH